MKTKLVTPVILFTLILSSLSPMAQGNINDQSHFGGDYSSGNVSPTGPIHFEVDADVKSSTSEVSHVHIEIADGPSASEELIEKLGPQLLQTQEVIIFSDRAEDSGQLNLPGVDTAPALQSAAAPEVSSNDVTTSDISPVSKSKRAITKKERIEGVIFATIQTGITTFAFVEFSHMPLEPLVVSTALAGFFNYYFNWDIERWDRIQRWGRNHIGAAVRKVAKPEFTKTVAFNKTTKSITGYLGRLTFATIFSSVALWDQLHFQFFTAHFFEKVVWASFIGALISQPFDTTFGDWLEKGHKLFKQSQVQYMMRLKSLMTAAIMPLVYQENHAAYVMAGAMLFSGITLVVYDQFYPKLLKKIVLSLNTLQRLMRPLTENRFIRKTCSFLLGKKDSEHNE
ncbi:MAG: hypothetical protein ABL927_10080 [Bdellovibrionales bacterium]